MLKLEYLEINQQFPTDKNWTLGKLIYELDWKGTRITTEILDYLKQIKEPRDDRAHAILEQLNPFLANQGGYNRKLKKIENNTYMIEPYHGDANIAIKAIFTILDVLYSSKEE